jgi:preprotein translocase subunit SecA
VPDEWDLDGLLSQAETYWPTKLTVEDLAAKHSTDGLYELVMGEATAHYEAREEALTPPLMRQLERQILLQILDEHWREHLYEMDYLREGIGLRAMGQRDPLTEWQREGYDMFQDMMTNVAQNFVTYVMKANVQVEVQAPPTPLQPGETIAWPAGDGQAAAGNGAGPAGAQTADAEPTSPADAAARTADAGPGKAAPAKAKPATPKQAAKTPAKPAVRNLTYTSSETVDDGGSTAQAGRASRALQTATALSGTANVEEPTSQAPLVKSDAERVRRNDPCHCGSGKKFKNCHGKAGATG